MSKCMKICITSTNIENKENAGNSYSQLIVVKWSCTKNLLKYLYTNYFAQVGKTSFMILQVVIITPWQGFDFL